MKVLHKNLNDLFRQRTLLREVKGPKQQWSRQGQTTIEPTQKLTKARKEEPWDPKTRIIQQMEKKQLQRTENCESFKQLPDTLTFHHE